MARPDHAYHNIIVSLREVQEDLKRIRPDLPTPHLTRAMIHLESAIAGRITCSLELEPKVGVPYWWRTSDCKD